MRSRERSQKVYLAVMIFACIAICVVHNWKPKRQSGTYIFQKLDSEEILGEENISWIYGPDSLDLETDARFRGGLLALFGAPLWESEDYENAYVYVIRAANENSGQEYILLAYQGPTGAAIGGNPEEEEIAFAAAALCELVMTTAPADFEADLIYEDTHSSIHYGCRDGEPFAEEIQEELRL